jgi:hypothetical protein
LIKQPGYDVANNQDKQERNDNGVTRCPPNTNSTTFAVKPFVTGHGADDDTK